MARRKVKAEAEKSIPELADEVTREEMRQMYRDGKLTAYGRHMSKFLERALPDEKVDEWGMESVAQGTCGDQATGGGEEGHRGKEEGRGACPRRVSAEVKARSEVQIATLPADQQEPARREWEKVLRPFKRREPWL